MGRHVKPWVLFLARASLVAKTANHQPRETHLDGCIISGTWLIHGL